MASNRFKEKELMMELCGEIIKRLDEKSDYYNREIDDYESRGVETLGCWEEEQYKDCKIYLSAIERIVNHMEKLI